MRGGDLAAGNRPPRGGPRRVAPRRAGPGLCCGPAVSEDRGGEGKRRPPPGPGPSLASRAAPAVTGREGGKRGPELCGGTRRWVSGVRVAASPRAGEERGPTGYSRLRGGGGRCCSRGAVVPPWWSSEKLRPCENAGSGFVLSTAWTPSGCLTQPYFCSELEK